MPLSERFVIGADKLGLFPSGFSFLYFVGYFTRRAIKCESSFFIFYVIAG